MGLIFSVTVLTDELFKTIGHRLRELKRIHIRWCRCNESLKAKTDGSKRLAYTGFLGELEHLKIETRLIGESFECVMGECVI